MGTVDLSSFISILSFGTTHDYIIGIAKYWNKYSHNKKLVCNINALPTVPCRDKDAVCSICLQRMDSAKELPCKHLFHSQCLEIWFANQELCPICRLNVADAIKPEKTGPAAEAMADLNSLLQPRAETVDELARLYELNFYARKHPARPLLPLTDQIMSLPREIHPARTERGRYTVGAVEFGLPTLAASERSYNSSIMGKHTAVLNANLGNFYKTYRDRINAPPH